MSERDVRAVALILLQRWDPIGIAEMDVSPESEYLFEATEIMSLLRSGSGLKTLVAYLSSTRRSLSAHRDPARDRFAADAVLVWWGGQRR